MIPHRFQTLKSALRHEGDKVKGSRFIVDVAPATSEAEAMVVVEAARAEFPDANHHCFAWVLDPEGKVTRANDDGEPGQAAGAPILKRIESSELKGVVVVVTRYFGGTKLGVGGMMRAYGNAAAEALELAERVEVIAKRRLVLTHPYECSGALAGALNAHEAEVTQSEYGESVRLELSVPEAVADAFCADVVELSAGRAQVEVAP